MARIRSIKPEFWTDEDVTAMSPWARLLFIGIWNFACDHGHVPDNPSRLKNQIFPADPVDVAALIDELVDHGRVQRILLADTRSFLHVRRFEDHQRVESRWGRSRCPACLDASSHDQQMSRPNSREFDQTRNVSLSLAAGKDRRVLKDKDHPGDDRLFDDDDDPIGDDLVPVPSKKTAAKIDDRASRFDEFWELYPRKVVKARARTAWSSALRKADAETILVGVRSYIAAHRDTPIKFIAHPATWLNQERWDDPVDEQPIRQPEWMRQ